MAGVVFNRFNGNSASGIVWCGYRRLLTADGANDFYTQVLFTDESSVLRYAVNTRLTPSTYDTPFPPSPSYLIIVQKWCGDIGHIERGRQFTVSCQ